ncbi:MAG: sulfatase-like hydrolase/transferase [Verrucomicrobiaceae bacterium]|nr:sulfatase-like hydrolase/transferase [Verrucomicrobiaceae bacterium]
MIRILILFALRPSLCAAQPNILHILADDMGWNALSCYGNKDLQTPNLDRLAAQGMQFTQAYADAQCSPTRAAFLSGQYGARTGVFKVLNEKEPSFAPTRSAEAKDALGQIQRGEMLADARLIHKALHQRHAAKRRHGLVRVFDRQIHHAGDSACPSIPRLTRAPALPLAPVA